MMTIMVNKILKVNTYVHSTLKKNKFQSKRISEGNTLKEIFVYFLINTILHLQLVEIFNIILIHKKI